MNIKIRLLVVSAFLFFVFVPNAYAENNKIGAKFQSFQNLNKKDCDINIPKDFQTIQEGINASNDGDTVCVGKGDFNEDILIDKEIRLSGKGSKKTKIFGQNPDASGTVYITAKNVIVEGFYIKGSGNHRGIGAIRQFENVHNTIIRFNYIVANDGQLAFLTDNAQQNNLVENNVLVGNNSPDIAKVNAFDSNKPTNKVDFVNNTFLGTLLPTDFQTEVFALDAGAPNSMILRNVFYATGPMISLVATNSTSILHENNFNTGPAWKVASTWGDFVNAENNWWGDLDPSDNTQGSVDFTPFANKPFKETKINN